MAKRETPSHMRATGDCMLETDMTKGRADLKDTSNPTRRTKKK